MNKIILYRHGKYENVIASFLIDLLNLADVVCTRKCQTIIDRCDFWLFTFDGNPTHSSMDRLHIVYVNICIDKFDCFEYFVFEFLCWTWKCKHFDYRFNVPTIRPLSSFKKSKKILDINRIMEREKIEIWSARLRRRRWKKLIEVSRWLMYFLFHNER